MKILPVFLLNLLCFYVNAQYYDWPLWRYDAERSASTPEQLADTLFLQWKAHYSARESVWDDPLNQNLMQFDRIFEPVVADGKLFIGFNDQDKVLALDLQTGKELWQFFTDGPVRLPLAAHNGNIYFTGDDGYCYCLNASTGALLWKRLLAPAQNKLLGNKRLISMWPARGGIVIRDNIIYTAAGIFPMMGIFLYALDAYNGDIIWKNEGTGSNYILQPHRSPAFAYVAPQGCFTVSGDKLLVAAGRSVPAAFNMETGKEIYYKLVESGKTGGAFNCANDKVFFNHHRERMTSMYDSRTGDRLKAIAGEYPVIEGDTFYFSGKKLVAEKLNSSNELDTLWELDVSATHDLIKAGNYLYSAGENGIITAVNIRNSQPKIVWTKETGKVIDRLLASNGKLIAVTNDGAILVYGETRVEPITYDREPSPAVFQPGSGTSVKLSVPVITGGYVTVYGSDDRELLNELLSFPDLRIIVLERDTVKIATDRFYYNKLGIPASRLCFLPYVTSRYTLPKYYSTLTIINDPSYLNDFSANTLEQIYESARPYNGMIWFNLKGKDQKKLWNTITGLNLYGLEVMVNKSNLVLLRTGALKGSDDWTHNYGNIENTIKSDDQLVKAPLGILWFGGNSNLDVLPRHGHGPSEQVIDGYLVIQGINSISARDVYTGRVIWKKEFEGLITDNREVFYDETYDENSPLDPKYNQVHLPGANARGTNYIVTKEYVYLIEGNKCHLLDLKTGDEIKTFTTGSEETQQLAYIGVYNNYLILGNNFTEYQEIPGLEEDRDHRGRAINPKYKNYDLTASRELIILDRFTGERKWSLTANYGFIHNSVIAGEDLLFCLDKLPQLLEAKLRRRGEDIPSGSRLLYLDIHSGSIIHEETENVFGTWLGYSDKHKLLLQANRPSRDMIYGESGDRIITYKTDTKEILWDKNIPYNNPPVIANDVIYTNGEAFSLLTGEPLIEKDPVTGEAVDWKFKREYGCGYVIASEHLLTFRSASAAFVNLDAFEGTASLGGFRAGCSANLIVANGVLNAPDYTRTCQCAYQNQTSLALIHMPWMSYWTNSNYTWNGKTIRKMGLNLNAPGDRIASNNTLWMEYPNTGGTPSEIPLIIEFTDSFAIRKEPVSIKADVAPWVSASALGGFSSVEIPLTKEINPVDRNYTVKLYFAELENKKEGERVFNINIQDKKVLTNFDIVKEAGEINKEVIRSFPGVKASDILRIELHPVTGETILSGIEILMEE